LSTHNYTLQKKKLDIDKNNAIRLFKKNQIHRKDSQVSERMVMQ